MYIIAQIKALAVSFGGKEVIGKILIDFCLRA